MSSCEDYLSRIDLYLDGELRGKELKDFNHHVKECSRCQMQLAQRRRLLERIRAARPLYAPSAEFRAEMASLLASPGPAASVPGPQHSAAAKGQEYNGPSWLLWLRSRSIPALIAPVLAIAVIVTMWRLSMTEAHANAFLDIAVDTHRQEVAGNLPLEVTSNSPTKVSTWFAQKVPFRFRLPTSQETGGQEKKYELIGGRLLNFKGTYSAYIAYRMQTRLISLLVTSASTAKASGGEETVAGRLTFHTHRKREFQIVTWTTHNLTYALVSAVTQPARQSCAVCHADQSDLKLRAILRSPAFRRVPRDWGI
jgi:anti-sigma factor RsiW